MKFVSAATVLSSTLLRDHSVLIEQLLLAQCGGEFAAQAHVAPLTRQGRLSACYLVTGGESTSVSAVTGARFGNAFNRSARNTPQAERGIVLKLRRAVRQVGCNSLGKSAAIAKALEGIISVPSFRW